MQCVRIEKLKQTSDLETLGVGYWVVGVVNGDIEVGKPVIIERYIRNGEKIFGIMNTSIVQKIIPQSNGLELHTLNSVYRVEFLDEAKFQEEIKGTKLHVEFV